MERLHFFTGNNVERVELPDGNAGNMKEVDILYVPFGNQVPTKSSSI